MTEINTRKRDIKSLIANKQTTIENELDSLIVKVKRLTKERDEATTKANLYKKERDEANTKLGFALRDLERGEVQITCPSIEDKIDSLSAERDEALNALKVAADLISTMPQYASMHPEQVLKMLKDTAPMFKLSRGSYAQKTKELLEATRGLSSTTSTGNQKIECLRSHLELVTKEMERYYNALTSAQRENLPTPESVQENID